ncbi:hypothetical protein F66182_10150 [Fusarium sp. NRRL 66182]|nr:hypothetical protein F66182_10150 [Fusarium sp. NRRL 66182]
MFDVIWTDPDRELVGEHRAKKEKKREQKNKEEEKEQADSLPRRSVSINSTRSSTESRFGFLRPRNGKHAKNRDKTSGLLTPSHHSSRSNSGSYHRSALLANLSDISLEATRAKRGNVTASASAEPVGSASYVSTNTRASRAPPRSDSDNPDLSSEILVSSEAETDPPITPSGSLEDGNVPAPLLQSDSPTSLVPSIRFPKGPKPPVVINFRPNDPDSWRPPEEWECMSREAEEADEMDMDGDTDMLPPRTSNQVQLSTCMDFAKLQDQVKMMAAASPIMVLTRIKQIWSVTDQSLHDELNLELKRWMLSILHHLDIGVKSSAVDSSCLVCDTGSAKVLALYESQVTASYLAALHPTRTIYHLSAEPLSNDQFPNVHPVLVPSTSSSAFPLAQQLFETVYSLSLPAVCASPEIPSVLKNISKCLRLGGSLQLTLIDPLPCAGTLGHRMRAWLEEHLLINLERHFRCTNPSKLFPDWMGEAGLRGAGSTLTTSKFYAVSASIRSQVDDSDPFIDRDHCEREVKAEVRSIIGRLLWMEVWGSFVTGDRWWWEDEGCVSECLQLGTVWDYHIIEGVKQEDTAVGEEEEEEDL